jgi:hypothetical protein
MKAVNCRLSKAKSCRLLLIGAHGLLDFLDSRTGGSPRVVSRYWLVAAERLAWVSMAPFGKPVGGGSSKTLLSTATLLSHRIGIARKETARLSNWHALSRVDPENGWQSKG